MTSLFKKAKDRSSKDKIRTASGSNFNLKTNPLNAPTEVVQATHTYIAQNSGELSFTKGDFFHVVRSAFQSPDGIIEITDPIKNVKGRAPAKFFKFFEKTHKPIDSQNRSSSNSSSNSNSNSNSNSPILRHNSQSTTSQPQRISSNSKLGKVNSPMNSLYGIVSYDFTAERSDELNVNAGDNIIICAHHEYEWFIAKFLNKIGEIGLVPVSYVQLIDTTTRQPYKEPAKVIIEREKLPTVDEWKAIKNKHKASAKHVGGNGNGNINDISRSSSTNSNKHISGNINNSLRKSSAGAVPIASAEFITKEIYEQSPIYAASANIESFSCTTGKYWYLVRANLSNGTTRSLCRYYEDFFNFHQKVLSAWPREGGKYDNKERKERIIPFIPGPLRDVSESLCHRRLVDLDFYLRTLLTLPDYISKSVLVNQFFENLPGDREMEDSNVDFPIQPERQPPNLMIINHDNQQQEQQQQLPQSQSQTQPQSQQQSQPQIQQQQQQQQSQNLHSSRSTSQSHQDRLSQSHQDRYSHYEHNRSNSLANKLNEMNLNQQNLPSNFPNRKDSSASTSSGNLTNPQIPGTTLTGSAQGESSNKFKLKFYYKDDIFAIAVFDNISINDLKKLIIPRIDECDQPNVENQIKIIPKNSLNIDEFTYDESDEINTDSQLWNSDNFMDKGKFLVFV